MGRIDHLVKDEPIGFEKLAVEVQDSRALLTVLEESMEYASN